MSEVKPIGELIEALIDYRGKTPPKSDSGVPLITAKVIKGGVILDEPREYISEEIYDSWMRRGLPMSGDILITTEAPLGEVAQVGQNARIALAQRVILLRPDSTLVDPQFLFHYLRSPEARVSLLRRASGTTVSGIRQPELRAVEVPLLARSAQETVGRILDDLDALIENNRQRIEVLAKMARVIYREWFVNFRFPGHQHATVVDSSVGPIPEDWVLSTCGDELTSLGGGTPSKNEPAYWGGGTVRWYTPSDLTKSGCRYSAEPELRITEAGLARSSARLFPAGSVLMTSRATLGVLTIATTAATTNQGFIVIPPDKRWSSAFILQWLDEHAVELASIATGATFKEITKSSFKRVPFLVPAQDVLDAHRAATDPIEEEIHNLEQQVRSLASLRDHLLPKLVTGQIDVSSLNLNALVEVSVA
jgi:type I restriction enzyme S subunit